MRLEMPMILVNVIKCVLMYGHHVLICWDLLVFQTNDKFFLMYSHHVLICWDLLVFQTNPTHEFTYRIHFSSDVVCGISMTSFVSKRMSHICLAESILPNVVLQLADG